MILTLISHKLRKTEDYDVKNVLSILSSVRIMLMSVQILEISASDDDQRLDRWLRRSFPQLTQGRIEKMCRKGEVRINGARCKASSRIKVGQSLRIPPLTNPDPQHQRPYN